MYQKIALRTKELANEVISLRRSFHQYPETAWTEYRTTERIAAYLQDLGLKVTTGTVAKGHETGVIGELCCGEGPVIALRFDIDALANQETADEGHTPNQEGFASERCGLMHACGHDGHTAIGLGCAKLLSEYKEDLCGTIRFIFQPAEEGCMGARAVTDNGWLDDADYCLAGHIVPRFYVEKPGVEKEISDRWDVVPVVGSLATSKINATLHGRSCHGATPEKGASVIAAMAAMIQSLNAIPRHSEGATFINIGRIAAGEGRNILAEHGTMELEVRGETTALNQYMESHTIQIIEGTAKLYGCEAQVEILGSAPSIMSSPKLYEAIADRCNQEYENLTIAPVSVEFKASEDAPIMMERVKERGGQAVYWLFPTDTTASLHKPEYDFDEKVLSNGVQIFSTAVYDICQQAK